LDVDPEYQKGRCNCCCGRILFPFEGCTHLLDKLEDAVNLVCRDASKQPKVNQTGSQPLLGTGRVTRNNIDWIEAGFCLSMDLILVAGEDRRDRSVSKNAPSERVQRPSQGSKLMGNGFWIPRGLF
jgi:hypothetical protein